MKKQQHVIHAQRRALLNGLDIVLFAVFLQVRVPSLLAFTHPVLNALYQIFYLDHSTVCLLSEPLARCEMTLWC